MLYQIRAPHFTAGIEVGDDLRVIAAAPILAWAIGKSWGQVSDYMKRKGWRGYVVKQLIPAVGQNPVDSGLRGNQ